MTSRPTKYPEWATNAAVNDILEPSQGRKESGWTLVNSTPEKPDYQTFNYWKNLVYQWITYLDTNRDYLDATTLGGAVNIGANLASTVNIGRVNATVNIYGTTNIIHSTDLQVDDKLITLNKNGPAGSGVGAGFEVEEDGLITAYVKCYNGGWWLNPPGSPLTLDINFLGAGYSFNRVAFDGNGYWQVSCASMSLDSSPAQNLAYISSSQATFLAALRTKAGVIYFDAATTNNLLSISNSFAELRQNGATFISNTATDLVLGISGATGVSQNTLLHSATFTIANDRGTNINRPLNVYFTSYDATNNWGRLLLTVDKTNDLIQLYSDRKFFTVYTQSGSKFFGANDNYFTTNLGHYVNNQTALFTAWSAFGGGVFADQNSLYFANNLNYNYTSSVWTPVDGTSNVNFSAGFKFNTQCFSGSDEVCEFRVGFAFTNQNQSTIDAILDKSYLGITSGGYLRVGSKEYPVHHPFKVMSVSQSGTFTSGQTYSIPFTRPAGFSKYNVILLSGSVNWGGVITTLEIGLQYVSVFDNQIDWVPKWSNITQVYFTLIYSNTSF